ncbi:MAG: CDP-alcohol phosphatidyltransferase family protein [Amaricoccus sp.]|uniref:CDP-alcohol phosphatidyltransferase family protein n=1 Tax=Amaricoccus sp. TaxID=1872485 RepID=UPI0039E63903
MSVIPTAPGRQVVRPAARALALATAATAAVLAALPFEGRLAPAAGVLVLAGVGAVALDRIAAFHPHPRFGLANAVTLVRAGATAVFAALALEPAPLMPARAGWAAFGLALALLALDGLDGWLARRQGLASAFGARFDMEVDALLILALSVLALGLGKAGTWVLAIGLMRYGFVAAGWLVPALAAPLPPSTRRRAVCGMQIAVLAVLLAPPLGPPTSALLAAAALAALAGSFAADLAHLLGVR